MNTLPNGSLDSNRAALLALDVEQEVGRLSQFLEESVLHALHRHGAVVGCSGGIDSSVVLALCARALGPERTLAVMLPERESSPESTTLAQDLAERLGVPMVVDDITAALEGVGAYERRDAAVRRLFPDFGEGWRLKITLPGSLLELDNLSVFYLTVVSPEGEEFRQRLPRAEYNQIVAATNFKQRIRMARLYYHAELRDYAVIGTAQRNEHDLGFFVKHGDSGVDVNPVQQLFKSQIYQLADCLEVPQAIRDRMPTTDTYSATTSQEEFFFRVPYGVLDTIWASHEAGLAAADIAEAAGLTPEQVERVIGDIHRKQLMTTYLRTPPLTLAPSQTRPAARALADQHD